MALKLCLEGREIGIITFRHLQVGKGEVGPNSIFGGAQFPVTAFREHYLSALMSADETLFGISRQRLINTTTPLLKGFQAHPLSPDRLLSATMATGRRRTRWQVDGEEEEDMDSYAHSPLSSRRSSASPPVLSHARALFVLANCWRCSRDPARDCGLAMRVPPDQPRVISMMRELNFKPPMRTRVRMI